MNRYYIRYNNSTMQVYDNIDKQNYVIENTSDLEEVLKYLNLPLTDIEEHIVRELMVKDGSGYRYENNGVEYKGTQMYLYNTFKVTKPTDISVTFLTNITHIIGDMTFPRITVTLRTLQAKLILKHVDLFIQDVDYGCEISIKNETNPIVITEKAFNKCHLESFIPLRIDELDKGILSKELSSENHITDLTIKPINRVLDFTQLSYVYKNAKYIHVENMLDCINIGALFKDGEKHIDINENYLIFLARLHLYLTQCEVIKDSIGTHEGVVVCHVSDTSKKSNDLKVCEDIVGTYISEKDAEIWTNQILKTPEGTIIMPIIKHRQIIVHTIERGN